MATSVRAMGALSLVLLGVGVVLEACSGDEPVAPKPDSGADSTVPPPPPPEAGPGDAGDAGAVVQYTVPTGGGTITVQGASQPIGFTFPASAAGKTVTFKVSDATAIGWPAGQFSDVLQLGPDGTRFADPVVVKPTSKNSLLLTFPEGTTKQPAEPLRFDETAGGYLLRHFSALVLVPQGKYCDSESYQDYPDAGVCSNGTTLRQLSCKGYNFCTIISASCCVPNGSDAGGCTTDDKPFTVFYTPTELTNNGQYPYCAVDAGDWDGGDAGCFTGLSYNYVGPGCQMSRSCAAGSFLVGCDGTGCTCYRNQVDAGAFPQGATCDNVPTMKTAWVQKCNFPAQ
jgi:hypothetical protein